MTCCQVACGNVGSVAAKIGAGDLQIDGGLLVGFLARMEQPQGSGAVSRAQAVLFACHVIVDVIPSAVFLR